MLIDGVPFLENGYLDIKGLEHMTPEAVFYWIIGGRQIGKTYGVLDMEHSKPGRYIFLRHNAEELKYCNSSKVNQFLEKGFPWGSTTWNSKGQPCFSYNDEYHDGKVPKVLNTCLSAIGKLRGIPLSEYDEIVFDEFIPVNSLASKDTDGISLQDFYFTCNSVREVEGKPPVKMWCLANSNNLNSPILSHWGLTQILIVMIRKGQKLKYLPKRRTCILLVDNSPISKKLRNNALFQALGDDSDYAHMALLNEFVNDDTVGVCSRPFKEYTLKYTVDDLNFYKHKSREEWYIVEGSTDCAQQTFSSKNPTSLAALMVIPFTTIPSVQR